MPGYLCFMLADLDTGLGFIFQTNGPTSLFSAALFARQALVAAAEGNPLPELPPLTDRRDIEQAGELAGSYQAAGADRRAFELTAEGQRLFMSYEGTRVPLWKIDEHAFLADHPDFNRLPLRSSDAAEPARTLRHGGTVYQRIDTEAEKQGQTAVSLELPPPVDQRGRLAGHYRTFTATLRNFRIIESPAGALLLVHPSGKEETLHRIDQSTWRVEQTPETIRFDTFVEGQALRASFSGCDYYRTFTA
jgi:hypothetical protein